jgi:hypothetical protein
MISYMRDHSMDDGLEYVATWNAAMLQSADLRVAIDGPYEQAETRISSID